MSLGARRGRSGSRARESGLAQQMLGGAADAVGFDGGGEFETQTHRLGYLGRPAELIAVDLAVANLGKVIGAGYRSRQCRPLGLEFEHARFVAGRRLEGDIP